MTREVLVLGAGKIGGAIVDLLHAAGEYRITLADSDAAFLQQSAGRRPSPRPSMSATARPWRIC